MKKQHITDPKFALEKVRAWCAYRERCQQEVRDKLYDWGLWPDAVENIIATLITENFVNEERFAKAFAGGKFRIKKWGRTKITGELKKRKISPYCIQKGLAEIPGDEYLQTLKNLMVKQAKKVRAGNPFVRKQRLANYAVGKGYESDLVWDILSSVVSC